MKNIIVIILAFFGIAGALWVLSAVPKKDIASTRPAKLDSVAEQQKDTSNMSIAVVPAERVEVFLFHRTQRCTTCIAIGKLSGQMVEERFGSEVLSGKVVFKEVNIDESQNKDLVEKFQAGSSSLFVNAIREGNDNIEEDLEVWRLTGDEAAFKTHLARKINSLLGKK